MIRLYFAFLLFLLSFHLSAAEYEIAGGHSPNGRYSILLVRNSETSGNNDGGGANYDVTFHDLRTNTRRPLTLQSGPQGFCSFEGAKEAVNSQAWWSPDSRFVALCFRTARHSRVPYLYYVAGNRIQAVQLPDYDAIIYGRLGVKPFGSHYVRCPKEWSDTRTLQLYTFGDLYACEVILRLEKKPGSGPKAFIVTVKKGEPLEG